jgi:hypothetical protein
MAATGFLAVDFAAAGPRRLTGGADRQADFFAGALTTTNPVTVFLVIDQPDATIDDPGGSTRPGPPG